jgi:N-acyl-L-homoserine lactone synthetase
MIDPHKLTMSRIGASQFTAKRDDLTTTLEQRYRIFTLGLKWFPENAQQQEKDGYDFLPSTEYLLVYHDQQVISSIRMLLGTHPTLSSGPLRSFWTHEAPPAGRQTAESTRGYTIAEGPREMVTLIRAIGAVGCMEWAVQTGIRRMFGVMDTRMIAAFQGIGWPMDFGGDPIAMPEGGMTAAVSWECTQDILEESRHRIGISRPILISGNSENIEAA